MGHLKDDRERLAFCSIFCLLRCSVYATTAGSPYVYRNFMVCTVGMGDNDMRKPRLHTKLVSTFM